MKPRSRAFLKTAAVLAAVVLLIGLLSHSSIVKDRLRRFIVTSLDDRLGGSSSIERLDYRLWRGEIRGFGMTWSSTDDAVSIRLDEVVVNIDPWGSTSVIVRSPELRMRPGDGEDGSPLSLPEWLFGVAVTVTDGRLGVGDLEVEGIETRIEPHDGVWEGNVSTERAGLRENERIPYVDSMRARFRIRSTSAEVTEIHLEKASSTVTGAIQIESFSPLIAEASITHAIDASLLREFLADVVIDETFAGESIIRRENDAWTGHGILEASGVTYAPLEATGIRVPWRYEADVLRIEDAELSVFGGQAKLSAAVDIASDTQELGVFFDGIEAHPSLASRVAGTASVSLQQWNAENARGHAELELRPDRKLSGVSLRGRVRADLDGAEVAVRAPRLVGPGFELDMVGNIGESLSLSYTVRVEDLAALGVVPADVGLAGSGRVEGRVEGPLAEPRATAEVSTSELLVSGVPLDVGATLSLDERRVELASLSVRHASGGALALQGSFDIETETLSLRGEGDDFELDEIPELEASISSIGVEIGGPLRALTGTATAELGNVRFRGVPMPSTHVVFEADGAGARLTASSNGEAVVTLRAHSAPPYAAEAEVRLGRFPLGELLRTFPDYTDTELFLEGSLFASGELAEPQAFRYRVEAEQVVGSYREVGFGVSAPFVLEGDRDTLTVRDLTLIGADTAIGIEGELPLSASGFLDVRGRGVARLELLSLWLPEIGLEGRVGLEIEARGALSEPELLGDVQISEARAVIDDLQVTDVRGRALFQGETMVLDELTGELLGGRFRVDGDLPFRPSLEREARIRFRLDELQPSTLFDSEDGLEVRLSASGELAGRPTIDLASQWRGAGRIESLNGSVGGVAMTAPAAASWSLEAGHFRFSELRLSGVDSEVVLAGDVNPFAEPIEWSALASGRIDPRFLAPTLSELGMALTGETAFDLRARQGLEPLTVEGTASIRSGRLAVREPALAFTNLTGDLELQNETVRITRLEANVGGGNVQAEGEIQLSGASLSAVDLRGRASSVRLSYPEGLRSEIDGALRLSGSPSELALTGDITLARAIFSRNINLQSELLESLSRVSTLEPPDSFSSGIHLDVRVRTREGLRVDNNLATMDASTNLVLGGTVAEPELGGTIATREGGEFRFGRNTYRIETGRIALQRYPVEPPELDIAARTTVSNYDIRLTVRGPADDLTTELSGTSQRDGRSISRADAASLLLTGRTIDNVSTEGRTILGEQMASYLGASLGDLAQLGLGGALPFDIVTTEPALIAGEADPSARFTMGAGLTESLSVVYSIGLNDAEKQIWIVDYELPRRTRTQLIRQEDNEFTFAFGQQLQFDRSASTRRAPDPRIHVSRLGFYFVTGEPGSLETEARARLGLEPGQRYDYWKAWERSERMRDWLRDEGFLEATADLSATSCGVECVELDVLVVTGKRVQFLWSGDEVADSLKKTLVDAWDGYMTPAFLATDIESIGEGMLFERRYYLANIDVEVEERPNETVVSLRVARGPRGARVAVDFTGNVTIPDETLRAALPKRSSTEFHELITSKRPRLKQILEVRCASLGYLQAEIGVPVTSFDAASGVLGVTIPVVEGEPSIVSRIELEGVERIAEAVVRSRLGLREGEPFRLTQFVQDRSSIAAFYRRQGFPDVEVDSAILPGDVPGSLVARYVVLEGPEVTVGDIRVAGNDNTKESVIRREIALKPGEPLRVSEVGMTQKRLYELGIFRAADVAIEEPEVESGAAVRDVVVEVTEAPEMTVDYGLRYTTDGLFQVVADVGAPNLLGRAQRVGFRTLFGTDERIFRFTYRTPYVARYKLSTDFFVERRVAEEVPEQGISFTERDWRFTAQQSRPLREKLSLQWSYSFKQTAVQLSIEDPILGPAAPFNQSIFTTALIGDYRDNVVNPSRGSLWSVTVQGAPQFFGSDFKFVKVFGQAYTFIELAPDVVWAGGYRAGGIENLGQSLLEDERFQAGGANSVRGFAQNSLGPLLGGEGVLIFNQEIRFPIFWRLHGVGFYDAGNAFAKPSDIRLSDLRHDAGAGLRLVLPFGLIRVDMARILDLRDGEDPWRFVFSLGHAF